jgi:TetR/AcrR family transcriptional repressor of nem operon
MGDLSEPFRERLKSALDAMKIKIAAFLYQAQEAGELPPSIDAAEICSFMVSSWEGALLQMKVFKSTAPLRTFDKIIFEHLLR